jgi:hypothetical protein
MKSPAALPLFLLLYACSPSKIPTSPDPAVVEERMIGLQTNFDELDRDGNGQLSRGELRQGMIKAGARDTSEAKVSKVMKFYDFNRNGTISLREAQSGAVNGADALIRETR